MIIGFETYSRKAREEYEKYESIARAEYLGYVHSVQSIWGLDSTVVGTPSVWIDYDDDYHSRFVVDFASGEVDVEVALDEAADTASATERLSSAVEAMLLSRGTTCPYSSRVDVSEPLTVQPVLTGLVDFSPYL